jgi:ribonucleotide monophosphatase NagD (HAD superfamily)
MAGHPNTVAALNESGLASHSSAGSQICREVRCAGSCSTCLRLDAGAFVRALEYAAGTTAVVLGKPDREFYGLAVRMLGVAASEAVMVGDDVWADVQGAQHAGLAGVLVRTGKFRDADLHGDVVPQVVLDSVADLPGWWSEGSGR